MGEETLDQSWLNKLRNRPWIATIVACGVVLGGIASTTNAVRDIITLFSGKEEIKQGPSNPSAPPEEDPRELIVGTWRWGTYADGRTMWVTVHSDQSLESTITAVNPDGTKAEVVNNRGTWRLVARNPPRYELHWESTPSNFVVTNFVSLSPDRNQLLEIDKGQEALRGTRASF